MTEALTVDPSATSRHRVPERPPLLAVGVMIWLGSELMFFSSLFAAYFAIRANAIGTAPYRWPPSGTELDFWQALVFSFLLIASSPAYQFGVWAIERGDRKKAQIWMVISWIMGAAFIANTLYEWFDFWHKGIVAHTNSFWSLFFIMTGIHGLHVVLGLVAMIFLYGRMRGLKGDPGEVTAYQAVGYYWHFVDLMWIGIFTCLFVLSTGWRHHP